MATLNKIESGKKSGKKKESGMNAAVASTEKIRQWVSRKYLNLPMFTRC
jgi:hypothetical protein